MRIAIMGAQCVGKTTLVNDFLKTWPMYKTPEKTYRDIIKDQNLQINQQGNQKCQRIIFDAMCDEVLGVKKEDFVIFDRCIYDNIAYTLWLSNQENTDITSKFINTCIQIARQTAKLYDIIFYIPLSEHFPIPLSEKEQRSVDPKYREEIDNIIKAMVHTWREQKNSYFDARDCAPIIEIFGSPEERIAMISAYVNENGRMYGESDSLIPDILKPGDAGFNIPPSQLKV